MATMTAAQRQALAADVRRELSSTFSEISGTKAEIDTAIGHFDDGLEAAETDILGRVSAGVRTWLQNNPTIARRILEETAKRRRENL